MKALALLSALTAILTSSVANSAPFCSDCVTHRGLYWEDISSTTDNFDVNCEYRIVVDSFLSWGQVAFYPSFVGSTFLSVDYSKANNLVVYSSNKAQTQGDHGTHTARTFKSCPTAIPFQH